VIAVGLVCATLVHWYYSVEISHGQDEFRHMMQANSVKQVNYINNKMEMFYQGLRMISRMPGVREIGHHAENLDERTAWGIRELYNSLSDNIDVSEVYLIAEDFDPDTLDPHTGRPFTPIAVFDHVIVGQIAGEDDSVSSEIDEIEIYEYRQIARHIDWMKQHFPRWINRDDLDVPAVLGEEVVTCDNRFFSPKNPNDQHRSGLVYAVPFYDIQGHFKGLVTGTILTEILRNMLPDGNMVIRNYKQNYTVNPAQAGYWQKAGQFIEAGKPDPNLIYSEVLPLEIKDANGEWVLWAGVADEAFWNSYSSRLLEEKNVQLEHEIEEHEQTHHELEVQEAKYHVVFNSVLDGIVVADAKGIINACNPAIERIFGYKESEILGKNVTVLMPARESAVHDQYISSYKNTTGAAKIIGVQDRQLLGLRRNGSTFPLELTVNSSMAGGRMLLVGVMRDISNRMKAEEELRASCDIALKAAQLKSEMLGNVSHELRTPMNGIMGCAELLKETDLTEEQSSYLGILSGSADRLLAIIDDLMDFSSLETGKVVVVNDGFHLRESLEYETDVIRDQAAIKGLEISINVDEGIPGVIYGDAKLLRRVLANLLANAVKFTHHGSVSVRAVITEQSGDQAAIRFEVRDTGPGVSSEHQRQIFQSFVQQDGSITREHGGLGLGLAICTKLVHAMEGEIGLDSVEGEGSTFWFQVPFETVSSNGNVI
jgi:PAS domain S-box-containing protein